VAFLLAFYWLTAHLFGLRWGASSQQDGKDSVRRLEENGMLSASSFEVTRAFHVEEFEDEGVHYFLELKGGGVLFLSGQYLYPYEPDAGQARQFPCSRFSIRRHRVEHYVVDMEFGGVVLEPEALLPPFTMQDYEIKGLPQDGDIIRDRTYEMLLHDHGGRTPP
jgi:hypothetical protein